MAKSNSALANETNKDEAPDQQGHRPKMETYTLSLFGTTYDPGANKNVSQCLSLPWQALGPTLLANNWSPATYDNGARNLANYQGHPSLFAFDIDEGMTLEEAKSKFGGYQCLIYTSRNHQLAKNPHTANVKAPCDRFRVVFALEGPLTNDSDFKATWDAYRGSYPLDPQTRSSSMFFFKGREVVFDSPTGKKLPIVTAVQWQEAKEETYAFTKSDSHPTRGKLSAASQDFLLNGAPGGMFNIRLFKCAVDHLEQRYTFDEFIGYCAEAVTRGAFGPLDPHDLATAQSAFNREPKYGARPAGASHIDAQKRDIVDRIMFGGFIQCVQSAHTLWYRVKDFELREVELFSNEQILERHLKKELAKPENHFNTVKKVLDDQGKSSMQAIKKVITVDEALEIWRQEGETIDSLPEPILWRGTEGWCHKRFAFELVPGQAHPAWDEFLSRLSHPEVFKAWVFGCFLVENETRQALWLLGKTGEDGKSKVINVIGDQFGAAKCILSGSQVSQHSRFALGQFIDKRIVLYPDCKHTAFTQSEMFRNLTGGDAVGVEFKGGGFMSVPLKTKVLIGSNYEPKTTGANYDKSRLIVIDVQESRQKDDPQWQQKLRDELPAFLGDAEASYRKLCPTGGKITLSKDIGDRLDDIAEVNELEDAEFLEAFFRVDENSAKTEWLTGIQLQRVFLRMHVHAINQRMHKFKVYLETKHKVFFTREGTHRVYKYLVFKDPETAKAYASEQF